MFRVFRFLGFFIFLKAGLGFCFNAVLLGCRVCKGCFTGLLQGFFQGLKGVFSVFFRFLGFRVSRLQVFMGCLGFMFFGFYGFKVLV